MRKPNAESTASHNNDIAGDPNGSVALFFRYSTAVKLIQWKARSVRTSTSMKRAGIYPETWNEGNRSTNEMQDIATNKIMRERLNMYGPHVEVPSALGMKESIWIQEV